MRDFRHQKVSKLDLSLQMPGHTVITSTGLFSTLAHVIDEKMNWRETDLEQLQSKLYP